MSSCLFDTYTVLPHSLAPNHSKWSSSLSEPCERRVCDCAADLHWIGRIPSDDLSFKVPHRDLAIAEGQEQMVVVEEDEGRRHQRLAVLDLDHLA